jgi:hypothetical protein
MDASEIMDNEFEQDQLADDTANPITEPDDTSVEAIEPIAELDDESTKATETDEQAAQHEQAIRRDYDTAKERKAAALDSGNMDEYRAAGMEAEARRLDLEFIEGVKRKGPKPAATVEDDSRVMNVLRKEHARIYGEITERLKKYFTEVSNDCAGVLKQFAELETLAGTWGRVVMRKENPEKAGASEANILIAGFEGWAKAQLERFKYIQR